MIYTVTLNPAIDYVVNVDQFQVGEINRSKFDYKEAGGKGINVSRVLNHFGTISTALGFVGGFTGEFITDYLTSLNISHDFVSLQQDTRINVKMKSESEETELNGVSPEIKESDYKTFNSKIRNLTAGDIVVLAGSLPDSLPTDTYRDIVATLRQQGVTAILDSSGIPFSEAIKAKPAFVKPNNHELAELFNEKIETEQDIVTLANRLHQDFEIDHVLVSMAKEGAIYVGKGGIFKVSAPTGEAVNSVGAGDSTVAGFLYKWQATKDAKEAARFAVAAGSATAFSKTLCTKEEVEALLSQVKITKL